MGGFAVITAAYPFMLSFIIYLLIGNVDIYYINVYSITESVGKEITKECSKIFPLQNVLIKKVKVLKKPKFDLTKLMELYQDKPEAPKAAA